MTDPKQPGVSPSQAGERNRPVEKCPRCQQMWNPLPGLDEVHCRRSYPLPEPAPSSPAGSEELAAAAAKRYYGGELPKRIGADYYLGHIDGEKSAEVRLRGENDWGMKILLEAQRERDAAQQECARLTKELEEVERGRTENFRQWAKAATERDRLRAALEKILREEEASTRPGGSLSRSGYIAREALSAPSSSSEERDQG